MSLSKLLSTSLRSVFCLALASVLFAIALGGTVSASRIGVGVGTGKIDLKNDLKPGLTYKLPTVVVFNNGDVTTDYQMSVQFNENQSQRKPEANWVQFSPQRFTLQPGKAREVLITLKPSGSARPGNYFAYLEAHPLKKSIKGKTAINIAAATKLSFTVAPANFWQKLFYALQDFWNRHKQICIAILGLIVASIVIVIAKRHFNLELRGKKYKNY